MIIQNKRIFASILFVLISYVCVAQNNPPPPAPLNTPPPGLPIDGGVIIGAVLGLFYGAKKLITKKQ